MLLLVKSVSFRGLCLYDRKEGLYSTKYCIDSWNSINDAVSLKSVPFHALCLHDRTGKKRSHKIRIKELTKLQTWPVIGRFRREETGPNDLREKGKKIGQ